MISPVTLLLRGVSDPLVLGDQMMNLSVQIHDVCASGLRVNGGEV